MTPHTYIAHVRLTGVADLLFPSHHFVAAVEGDMKKDAGKATAIGPVTNGGKETIELSIPYIAHARLEGATDILFHAWSCEAVDAKAKAAKGSAAKKTDNLESYVYRNDQGQLCVPGEYVRQSLINAAKFRQDPRSPRKSAMDLFKAAVAVLTPLAPIGPNPKTNWDYEDSRRVQVQRQGITRVRPAMKQGWTLDVDIMVNLPEYVPSEVLHETLVQAGRLIGLADFRPTYGRFGVTEFRVTQ